MNFKILLNSAIIFQRLQQEPSVSYFRVSLLCWLLPRGPCPFSFPKCPGEVTALLLHVQPVDPVPSATDPKTLHFTFYFVTCLQRCGQHDVDPQHPTWNMVASFFCVTHCSEHCVCRYPSQFILSSPGIRVQGFPCFRRLRHRAVEQLVRITQLAGGGVETGGLAPEPWLTHWAAWPLSGCEPME